MSAPFVIFDKATGRILDERIGVIADFVAPSGQGAWPGAWSWRLHRVNEALGIVEVLAISQTEIAAEQVLAVNSAKGKTLIARIAELEDGQIRLIRELLLTLVKMQTPTALQIAQLMGAEASVKAIRDQM